MAEVRVNEEEMRQLGLGIPEPTGPGLATEPVKEEEIPRGRFGIPNPDAILTEQMRYFLGPTGIPDKVASINEMVNPVITYGDMVADTGVIMDNNASREERLAAANRLAMNAAMFGIPSALAAKGYLTPLAATLETLGVDSSPLDGEKIFARPEGVSDTVDSSLDDLFIYNGELDFPNPGEASPKVNSTVDSSVDMGVLSKYEDPFYLPTDAEDWLDVNKNQAVPSPVFSKFSDEELKSFALGMPSWEKETLYNSWVNSLESSARDANIDPEQLKDVVFQLKNYNPPVERFPNLPIPPKQPIGEPASDQLRRTQGLEPISRPNPAADALGFTETVYHSTPRNFEFTRFKGGDWEAGLFDAVGTHVGTARAANERWLATSDGLGTNSGLTMELRARTDKPATDFLSGFLDGDEAVGDVLTEEQVRWALREIANTNPYRTGRDGREDLAYVSEYLADRGFTHIPYKNDVEDVGSTSYIMLTSRRNSPAVLRDSRAAFDPERINESDLRFAKGGEVKPMKQQMNLFEEGGLADDGMTREPVTGNEIPAGSLASEVRDDIDAKLSPGEYVVPADVVRFFGVKFFEDLRAKAKSDMMSMEEDGRVGGEPVSDDGIPMEDDELTPEEEAMLAEALAADKGYAAGGYVPTSPYNMTGNPYGMGGQNVGMEARQYVNSQTGETRTFQFLNGQSISMIPAGFVPATPEAVTAAQTNAAMTETAGTGVATGQTPSVSSNRDDRDNSVARQVAPSNVTTNTETGVLNLPSYGIGTAGSAALGGLGGAIIGGGLMGTVGGVSAGLQAANFNDARNNLISALDSGGSAAISAAEDEVRKAYEGLTSKAARISVFGEGGSADDAIKNVTADYESYVSSLGTGPRQATTTSQPEAPAQTPQELISQAEKVAAKTASKSSDKTSQATTKTPTTEVKPSSKRDSSPAPSTSTPSTSKASSSSSSKTDKTSSTSKPSSSSKSSSSKTSSSSKSPTQRAKEAADKLGKSLAKGGRAKGGLMGKPKKF